MHVNAVFEGGGVKAIALVGAVKAMEERGIAVHRSAGTSSGSIVASLLAAGYTADEMKKIVEQTPFSSFVKKTWLHDFGFIGSSIRLLIKKGLYSGEALEQWIRKILLHKGIRVFGDLEANELRIIASDISRGRLLVLPDDIAAYGIDPQRFEVSKAIRMSTSIPYFFDPVRLRMPPKGKSEKFANQFIYIVDGGLLSNFPLWLFDESANKTPTIGFQLVGRGQTAPRQIGGPLSMLQALFSTMMDAHDERFIEDHNRFRTIKIPTLGVHTTQFDIQPEMSMKLYESGMKAANKFFDKWSVASYLDMYDKLVTRKQQI